MEEKEVKTDKGQRVVLTYEGEKSFTLIEEKAEVVQAKIVSTTINGNPVDLGFTVGAMTNNMITWTFEGVNYTLASQNMTPDEMIEVARTVV